MSSRQGLIDGFFENFAPIHRDGHKFVAGGVITTLLLFFLWPALGWLAALATIFIAFFFRDPDRVTPLREGLVIAAADGRITAVETARPPVELDLGDEPRVRISTRLSLADVHINRAPIAGRVTRSAYVPGAFLSAASDKANDDNERRALVITAASGAQIAVLQIAGFVTRRIVTFAHEGDNVGVGQRFGLIRFGSQVDVYLPPGANALVATGQRAIAGETVLADIKSSEPEREARRS